MDGSISELIRYWDIVAKNKVLTPVVNKNFELAEDGVAELIEIDVEILRKVNQLEKEVGV